MVAVKMVRATEQDKPRLAALSEAIWLPYFKDFFSPDELAALYRGMYGPQALDKLFQNPRYKLYFLMLPTGSDVGYLGVERDANILKLDKIYVDDKRRGTGLGTWAMGQVLAMARTGGVGEVRLRVNVDNTAAIDFYRKHGFETSSRQSFPGPMGFVYDDYWMVLKIGKNASHTT